MPSRTYAVPWQIFLTLKAIVNGQRDILAFKQSVVIDNRAGGGATIGTRAVATLDARDGRREQLSPGYLVR